MSLSFVKSAVLSSTDGVSHNEETTIDNKETQSLRASGGGGHRPLFDQLRANKEAEQEKDDEFQRSLRGMRPLDEEDCAHLDAVDRMREEKEYAVKSGIEREVALFHAAREDRGLSQTVIDGGGGNGNDIEGGSSQEPKTSKEEAGAILEPSKKESKKIVPKFTIKKKRKRLSQGQKSDFNCNTATTHVAGQDKNPDEGGQREMQTNYSGIECDKSLSPNTKKDDTPSDSDGVGLLGLGCYDSNSD